MTLRRITMQLARNPGHPVGDVAQGYILIAPLTEDGHLDAHAWAAQRKACRVLRFGANPEGEADGWLTHRGDRWFFHYDEEGEGDDEDLFRLGSHLFKEGEYITVRSGQTERTFRITDISPV